MSIVFFRICGKLWLEVANHKTVRSIRKMQVEKLEESEIQKIGHAFGYYDYKGEEGLVSCYRSQEAAAIYINGYVRMTLKGKFLYSTSEKGEAYIAYKLSGQKISFGAAMELVKGFFQSMNLKELVRFLKTVSKGGPDLKDKMNKEKKPYIYVGMLCVTEKYQGQGFMRKALEMAFAEGNRLHVPVILDTDAKSKCDKYVHLGMQLAGVRDFGEHGKLYDLIKYSD